MFHLLTAKPRTLLVRGAYSVVVALFLSVVGASAGTLTITDDDGKQSPIELQPNDYVRLTATQDGSLYLEIRGFTLAVNDGGTGTGDGGTGTGDGGTGTGDGGTGTGDSGTGTGDGGTGTGDSGTGTGDGGTGTGDGGTGTGDGGTGTGDGGIVSDDYCAGNDSELADCRVDQNFDPWIASTGESPYWIRNRLTEVFPFTLPDRADHPEIRYGYLQLTTGERKRDAAKEDIFHMWFSETPNGPVLSGKDCEWYGTQAKTYFRWTQDQSLAKDICFLGTESRTLYMNFETRCMPKYYAGTCGPGDLKKSSVKYQFDVSRRLQGY